jgi:nitrate/nitrite transporter NarK
VVSAASFLLLLAAYPHPPVDDIGATTPHHSAASLRRSLTNKRLWIMSIAYFGGYGSYFTAVAMIPGYAVDTLRLPPEVGQQLGSILLLSGILGSFLAGWLADRVLGLLRTFLLASVLEAAALIAIPWIAPVYLPWAATVIGAMVVLAFVSWIGLPGVMQETFRASDVPTAAGLMLTIAAVGGVILPSVYVELTTKIGSGAGWYGMGAITLLFACVALLDRNMPQKAR